MHVCDAVGDGLFDLLLAFSCLLSHVARYSLANRTTRALAGPGVCTGALTANREAATVAQAPVTSQVHQALDVHADFTSKIAFDAYSGNGIAQLFLVGLGKVANPSVRRNRALFADLQRTSAADAVYLGQRDPDMLVGLQINACNTSHFYSPCAFRRPELRFVEPSRRKPSIVSVLLRFSNTASVPNNNAQPCRCLCFGSEQITNTTPRRRTILQLRQIFLTDACTFIFSIPLRAPRPRAGARIFQSAPDCARATVTLKIGLLQKAIVLVRHQMRLHL